MKKMAAVSAVLILMSQILAVQDLKEPDPNELHPGYDLMTIRPLDPNMDRNGNIVNVYPHWGNTDEFDAPVTGLAWAPDGDLLVVTWRGTTGPYRDSDDGRAMTGDHDRGGKLWKFSGIRGTDREDIQAELIADDFFDAHGIEVVDGEIYVLDLDRIVHLEDNNNDGFYETHETFGEVPYNYEWFGYAAGPVYVNDTLFITTFSGVQGSGMPLPQFGPDRGTALAYPMDGGGTYEVIASGFRAPNGLARNPQGDLFFTDNQGGWRPASMFSYIQRGRNYGYRSRGTEFLGDFYNEPVTPPSIWGSYGEIEEGPTDPLYMPTGIFKDQFFCGDIGRGGIKRWFVEKINGEYQGGVMPFTSGLEVGIDRIEIDEDGTIYAGGCGVEGHYSNQAWRYTQHGLQKLTPNGTLVFEMLRAYLRDGGLEIEFTKPVFDDASSTGNYYAEQWRNVPEENYGAGQRVDRSIVNVSEARVSQDGKRVFLQLNGLQQGYILHVRLHEENYRSAEGETPWFHEVWYTMNNFSDAQPFEIPGCMDENYEEYNPEANIDDGSCQTYPGCTDPNYLEYNDEANKDDGSCQTLGINAEELSDYNLELKSIPEGILISVPFEGTWSMQITGVGGEVWKAVSSKAKGDIRLEARDFSPGIYFVRINRQGHTLVKRFCIH
jgi:hypothetical protein